MGTIILSLLISILTVTIDATVDETEYLNFPPNFKIGAASSAHQIEGGWNASDKSPSTWDKFVHDNPNLIQNCDNADVACDSFNRHKEDVALLKDLGVDFYRFSLSWPRILPNGFANKISIDGLRYYKDLVDDLISAGIEPVATLYHWDHPAVLEEFGGWTNDLMIDLFADYARFVFQEFGDRIKYFVTFNEPVMSCSYGYGSGSHAPGKKLKGIGPYLCMHNMLKAQARVYEIYDKEFRNVQNGKIGIVLASLYYYPKNVFDKISADSQFAFDFGIMGDPIFSKDGDYPAIVKQRIGENSKIEGYPRSRLPEFSESEIKRIKGSADFLGLNHYTSVVTESVPRENGTKWYRDTGVITSSDPDWPTAASSWLKIVPQGFGDLLRKLKDRYDNPTIHVMENGVSDDGTSLNDSQRIHYYHDYIRELLLAVNRDGCNVKRYTAWSLLDNFEWLDGYVVGFGLVSVNFDDPARSRTPKRSFHWFQKLLQTRELPGVS